MDENKLLNLLNELLQKNNNNLENNEMFSMVSLLILHQITNIYQKNNKTTINNLADSLTNSDELPSTAENSKQLSSLLGTLQQADSNDLQKLLPLLMGTLNGNNNLGNLMNMIKPSADNNKDEQKKDNTDTNNTESQRNKKKTLDWSRLRL